MRFFARALGYSQCPVVLGTMAVRPRTLAKCSKGRYICLHAPPAPHIPCPLHKGMHPLYPKWITGLSWAYHCSGYEGKTHQPGQSRLEQLERWMKRHMGGGASSWHIRSPIKGTRHLQASYLSPDQEVSFTPLRVGWHRAVQVFH
jgi:hypothetical protein